MRKLAIASFSFSAAVFAAEYCFSFRSLWFLSGAFLMLGFLLLLPHRKWLRGFVLAAFGLAAGFLCFAVHGQRLLLPAQKLDGETREITGMILEEPVISEGYSRAILKLKTAGLPAVNVVLFCEEDALDGALAGDRISCTAKLRRADQRYGERFDAYLAREIFLIANAGDDLQLQKQRPSLAQLPNRVNRWIAGRIDEIYPKDTSAFMKSLMLGDKQELYQDEGLYLAMGRAGFLHIVAVSGMHIAFLVGLIQLLFGNTRKSALFCLLLVWFFVLVTGAPVSAIRAAIMQSFLLAATMFRRENDPATSLSVALALILAVNPFAAGSVSLQLSFGAMAGILCLAMPFSEAMEVALPELWGERLRGVIATAANSLAVMTFTVPLMAIHFGSVPILSPVTNIFGLWAVSGCFCGGYLSCFGSLLFMPLGEIFAWIVSWFARYLFLLARLISSIPFSTVYLKGVLPILWILLVYLLGILAFTSRLSPGKKLLLPLTLSALSLAVMLGATRIQYRSGEGVISVLDVGQGQCLCVMSGDETLMIDCGGLNIPENAGERAGAYLLSCGRKRIDVLVLTHLHADHCNGITLLMEMLPVKRIILQEEALDEDQMLEKILSAAQRHGTEIIWLGEDRELKLGNISAQLFQPGLRGDANERCITGVFSLGEYDMLVTGDSTKVTERELLEIHPLNQIELLIVGHHGSRYASAGELLDRIGAETAVISVGYNHHGHPTKETLERLAAYGYNIYRTDLNGTVEIRIKEDHGKVQ